MRDAGLGMRYIGFLASVPGALALNGGWELNSFSDVIDKKNVHFDALVASLFT